MRAVCVAVAAVIAFAFAPESAFAQVALPPLVTAPNEGPALPNGTEVSRPLTPIDIPEPPAPGEAELPPKPNAVQRVEDVQQQKPQRRGPLGPAWDDLEFLLWWPKAHPVPPLVTGTRNGTAPTLSNPQTMLLVGGRAISNQDSAGGRFTLGWSINEPQTVGVEMRYFFLGSRTLKTTITDIGNPRLRALGLPYVNAVTGSDDVFPLASPGLSMGSIYATTTTRVQGAEANVVANLLDTQGIRVNGLLGYRFLQVHEGLTVEQMRYATTGSGTIYDEFVGHNRFNGGQLGLHADLSRGIVFCELTGKVALGQTFEMVRIDGVTTLNNQRHPGGVFALPTNIGRYTRSAFAVVPEGTFRLGLKFNDAGRLYVGYNFLYLSDVARPGDQLDRTVNPAQIASLNPGGTVGMLGPDRPRPMISRTDFWTQGLVIGLETRY